MTYQVFSVYYKNGEWSNKTFDSRSDLVTFLQNEIIQNKKYDTYLCSDDDYDDLIYGLSLPRLISRAINIGKKLIENQVNYGVIAVVKGEIL
jgi:hypothetical protein